jgi:hypothetical protein
LATRSFAEIDNFEIDETFGRIVGVGRPASAMRDPKRPELTGRARTQLEGFNPRQRPVQSSDHGESAAFAANRQGLFKVGETVFELLARQRQRLFAGRGKRRSRASCYRRLAIALAGCRQRWIVQHHACRNLVAGRDDAGGDIIGGVWNGA